MSRAARDLNIFAESLLGYEEGEGEAVAGTAAFRVCEKLRHLLSPLLGVLGFRALLARSLIVATAEAPELRVVTIRADGSLEGLAHVEPPIGEGRFPRGEVVLIAELLGLLVTFIGEALMLRLVQGAWPEATLDVVTREKRKKS